MSALSTSRLFIATLLLIGLVIARTLNILLFHLLDNVVRRAPRQRENRPRWIFIGLRDKSTRIDNKHIACVVQLAELIGHRIFRI